MSAEDSAAQVKLKLWHTGGHLRNTLTACHMSACACKTADPSVLGLVLVHVGGIPDPILKWDLKVQDTVCVMVG